MQDNKDREGQDLDFWQELSFRLRGYVSGQTQVCLILGVFYAASFWMLDILYGPVLGLLLGFMTFVPLIGPLIGFAFCLVISFIDFQGWGHLGVFFLAFIVGQIVEGNYLTPKLVGSKTGLHPVAIFLSIFAGGFLLGPIGMIVAVPIAIIVAVFLKYYRNKPDTVSNGEEQ